MLYQEEEEEEEGTTVKIITLLINTSQVTSITEHNINPCLVPVLASVYSTSTYSHMIQTWSMKFSLKQIFDSSFFTDQTNNRETHPTSKTIQIKQYAYDNYHPYIDGLFASNLTMTIH